MQKKEGRIHAVRRHARPHPTTLSKANARDVTVSRDDDTSRRDNSKLNARSKWSVILVVILISWPGHGLDWSCSRFTSFKA